ncbi:MAG: malonate transporter [Dinoroseobacter sp.]
MDILRVLSDPILPVFAILAFGFVLGRAGKISVADARVINRFAMTVLLPIFIFDLIANAPVYRFSPLPVLAYGVAELVLFVAGYILATRIFKRDPVEAVLLAWAGVFANNALYVLPLSVLLYGEAGAVPVASIVTLDSIVPFAGVMIALQALQSGRIAPLALLRGMAQTPMQWGIFGGLAFSLLAVPIPSPVQTFLDFNGVAAAPVALFGIGVVMSQTQFQMDRVVASFAVIKLIAFPLAVWAGLSVLAPQDAEMRQFLLASAGPAGVMTFTLAILHGVRTDALAQIIVWTSVLSLLTLALLA